MFKSNSFYMRVWGDYAMFTTPTSKGMGEKTSYPVPTREALRGIADEVYFKPTLCNVIDEVKVINQIQTETMGVRTLKNKGGNDLSNYSYLKDVEYLVKFHFEWNYNRKDLERDRNEIKHQEIMKRSLKKGGRRDIFLGVRECVGFIEYIREAEYVNAESYYNGQTLSMGIMFHSFIYPDKPGEKLVSCFDEVIMSDGVISFRSSEDTIIKNNLENYTFKYPELIKDVDKELEEYNQMEASYE